MKTLRPHVPFLKLQFRGKPNFVGTQFSLVQICSFESERILNRIRNEVAIIQPNIDESPAHKIAQDPPISSSYPGNMLSASHFVLSSSMTFRQSFPFHHQNMVGGELAPCLR